MVGAVKCSAAVTVRLGLPLPLRHEAARLIWAGFGPQIAPGAGQRTGIARIRRGIRRDRVIVALDGTGALAGLTGLRGAQGGIVEFAAPAPGVARRLAQRLAAVMAGRTDDLVLDCLIVAPSWRGRGVAAALIAAALIEAERRGYPGLRAEVRRRDKEALRVYRRAGLSEPRGWRPGCRILRRSVQKHDPDTRCRS